MENIAWFKEIKKEDIPSVGGKGASLGEMYNIPLPVPAGFVVTTKAFKEFLEKTGIREKILSQIRNLKAEETEKIQEASKKIKNIILETKMLKEIKEDIKEAYETLYMDPTLKDLLNGTHLDIAKPAKQLPLVAVRSSATAEDVPEASFAGQQETFLNIKGQEEVINAVRECWASLYTARAIYYRIKNNFKHDDVYIAVVVQRMAHSDIAGVMFTINPTNNKEDEIMIEGAYGLGDAVVGGEVTPDTYIVNKETNEIKKKISTQTWFYNKDGLGGKVKTQLTGEKGTRQKLPDEGILKLVEAAKRIQEHYGMPMDIEWAVEGNKVYIVQARPITTMAKVSQKEEQDTKGEVILEGLGASPGAATGKVKIVHNPNEINKVEQGDILVAIMTSPDYVPAMEKAGAIVTDEGGMTSHAAIVSRELGIPAVVGTEKATKILQELQEITVDGHKGKVFTGEVTINQPAKETIEETTTNQEDLITATKVYMNLGEPEKIEQYKNLPFDGIGLMRIEFIITSWVKAHPLYLIKEGREQEYINKLAEGISMVAKAINNKPIIVRFSDFKSNEYKNLEGGAEYEPHEENPMIGWRGVSRYVSPDFEKAFRLECKAIKKARENYQNINVMLPFVRMINKVEECLAIMKSEGLEKNDKLGIYLMAEVPSFALLAQDFAQLPISGCSIGSNDLTQLVLGVDRDSAKLGKAGYFDEHNPAVKKAIKMIIDGFHAENKTISLCGQAGSDPKFAEFLVRSGIDAISANPDAVSKIRHIVSSIERKLILEQMRQNNN